MDQGVARSRVFDAASMTLATSWRFPALWMRHDAARVATTLLDSMVRTLYLEFAYVRAAGSADAFRGGVDPMARLGPNRTVSDIFSSRTWPRSAGSGGASQTRSAPA